MYRRFYILLLCTLLTGCAGFEMPQMPKLDISSWQMPDMAAIFSKGDNVDEAVEETGSPHSMADPATALPKRTLKCEINEGVILIGEEWYEYKPASFSVDLGQQQTVNLKRGFASKGVTMVARYDTNGQKLVICPVRNPGVTIQCEGIFALEDDFAIGIKRTLDVAPMLQGGRIACRTIQP